MFQWLINALLFEYTGIFIRWLVLYVIDSLKGEEPKSFNEVKNKYKRLSADSVAYAFGNNLIGTAFLMSIILMILLLDRCN